MFVFMLLILACYEMMITLLNAYVGTSIIMLFPVVNVNLSGILLQWC